MSAHLDYKGYIGSAEVDVEGLALVGKLLFIRDTITYSASSVEGLESAFREAVDDYLAACAEDGTEPDSPCKGSFNVRVGPALHREVAIAARRGGVGLNDFVYSALVDAVSVSPSRTIVHKHEVRIVGTTGAPKTYTALTGANENREGPSELTQH